MRKLKKQEQAAIEAIARHFSGTWEQGEGPPDAYANIAGKRIAIEVTSIKQQKAKESRLTKPRLRFDSVALGLIRGLRTALREFVPDGKTIILTVTAPIRMPSKTVAALEDTIRGYLIRPCAQVEASDTIHGNKIRIRLVKGTSTRTSNVIGFVHNPDTDPDVLLDTAQSLLKHIGAELGKRAPTEFRGDRWLVLANDDGLAHIETYRHVYSQLSVPTDFKKTLMVLAGERVEALTG